MDLVTLTAVFGWMTLINIAILAFSGAMLMLGRSWIVPIHSRLSGLDADALNSAYFNFLAGHKLAVIVLNLVPYLALRIVA